MRGRPLLAVAAALLAAATSEAAAPPGGSAPPVFVDRAVAAGIDFVHDNGMTGENHMVEILGAGAALFDYDNDGDLDVYLVQGGPLGTGKPLRPPAAGRPSTDRLYRNELIPTGRLQFTDVTTEAGLTPGGSDQYGQGVATGDFDDDGWIDIYRTAFGHNRLLRNTGVGGKRIFVDVTAQAGVDDSRWSSSATFFDYDRDGRLDLFVVAYVDFTIAKMRPCVSEAGFVDYCGPLAYKPLSSSLFHNLTAGAGPAYEDVSRPSGIAAVPGNGLGVVAADFDGDGWQDLYVTDDAVPNRLWLNRRNGTFVDDALLGGCAVAAEGRPQAGMGVTAADFDGDGDEDLFVTNLTDETNTLYVGDGRGLFNDETAKSGLGPPSLPFTSFGTREIDYDGDGWLDLVVVSGTVKKIEAQVKAGELLPLKQANQLFHNLGRGRFEDASARAGDLAVLNVGRGAAFGDVDNDGDTDVLVTRNNDRPQLLLNQVGQANRWLGLRLVGGKGGRDMLGARVTLRLADGRQLVRRVRTDGSYLSASDPRVLFGLGPTGGPAVAGLSVLWPDGRGERWDAAATPEGRYTTLRQGSGKTLEGTP